MVATRSSDRHDQLVPRALPRSRPISRQNRPRAHSHPVGRARRLPPRRNGPRKFALLHKRRTLHFRQRHALAPARRARPRLPAPNRFLPKVTRHFGEPLFSVTIARLEVTRRKPTCPVGATIKSWFRGARMSGRLWSARLHGLLDLATMTLWGLLCLVWLPISVQAQERREREPNSVYAERRAKLATLTDSPIVLWGFTGREEISQTYIFEQEENFYYLTGHNEEGAGLIILPTGQKRDTANIPSETLFLPAKNSQKEKWNGVRMSPTDPGIEARTGFASVKSFDSDFRIAVENLAKTFPSFYTILPYQKELGGYPHEKAVVEWLQLAAPQAKLKDIRAQIGAMRQIKSPSEIAFMNEAIGLTLDSHLEAMKLMHPGLYEYQVAAKMVEVHAWGGSEAEGYAPIVGAGPNSTALHYDK